MASGASGVMAVPMGFLRVPKSATDQAEHQDEKSVAPVVEHDPSFSLSIR